MNRFAPTWVLALAAGVAPGCALMSSPFRDDLAGTPSVTTPSADGVRAASIARPAPQRRFQPVTSRPSESGVTHAPLYFEDPAEVTGSDDGRFAWTGEDYWFFLSWRGRFLVNLVLFPVNFVDTPIWTVMSSDGALAPRGILGEPHDAVRSTAVSATSSERPQPQTADAPGSSLPIG